MALKQIKNKIRSTERTGKVTKAMEAVSAVKMRKGQERALAGRSYAKAALRILREISGTVEGLNHELAEARGGTKKLYIVITSDKGLAGNINSAVLKLAESKIQDIEKNDLSFICLGRKASDYFSRRDYEVLGSHTNISDEVELPDMHEIVETAVAAFKNGKADSVEVIYQSFISTFEQEAVARKILPLDVTALTEIVKGITPQQGKYAEEEQAKEVKTYTIEPSESEVLNQLIPQLVEVMVYHAMLEAKASEHSARMVAMKNASDKAKEVTKLLTLQFNKERQAVITREVSEITGGIEAMAQK